MRYVEDNKQWFEAIVIQRKTICGCAQAST